MSVVSSYYWSGFPFDNLCENNDLAGNAYLGTWNVTTAEHQSILNVTISENDMSYRFCLQDLLRTKGHGFPAVPKFQPKGDEWMTSDQEVVTTIYGWTSVGVMGLVLISFLWAIVKSFRRIFKGTYKINQNTLTAAISCSLVSSMVKAGLCAGGLVAVKESGGVNGIG